MPISRSTLNPSPISIRKAQRAGGDYLFVYLRSNPSKFQVEDMDGEAHIEYQYQETQLRIPLPSTGLSLWAAAHHARDQTTLKRSLRTMLLNNPDLRQQLVDALGQARSVDRSDNLRSYHGTPAVDMAQERQWAEARCVIVAPQDVGGLQTEIVGEYTRLADVGDYRLWSANAPVDTLLALHAELWAMEPQGTLGVLAVVREMGEDFLAWGVRDATGMTTQEAVGRRDRISAYLQSLGKDTTELDAAEDEYEQMTGIAAALGHALEQLWQAM